MTTPATPRLPYLTCRSTPQHDSQPLPTPGTTVDDGNGAIHLYVGDHWPIDGLNPNTLAAQLRNGQQIYIIGNLQEAARPAARTIRAIWSRANQAHRTTTTPLNPLEPTKGGRPRCGRPRVDGQPCRAVAGAGTDTLGQGPCCAHGGDTTLKDQAARDLEQLLRRVTTLNRKQKQPLTRAEKAAMLHALQAVLGAPDRPLGQEPRPRSDGSPEARPSVTAPEPGPSVSDVPHRRESTMNPVGSPQSGHLPVRPAAIATAVAIVTATSTAEAVTSVEELLADGDPLEVLAALGAALSLTLGALLGDRRRAEFLAELGLRAAQEQA